MRTPPIPLGALSLGSFVFWLLAFPMQGLLLPQAGAGPGLAPFLLPQIAALFLVPRLCSPSSFPVVRQAGILATAALTLVFPLLPGGAGVLLPLLGLTSPLLLLDALARLSASEHRLRDAALGVAGGNLLVFLLPFLPIPRGSGFLLVALPLCVLGLWAPAPGSPREQAPVPRRRLALLFLFYLTGGLLYGFLMPRFAEVAPFRGAELLVYVAAAALVPLGFRKSRADALLVAGIFAGALSFSLVLLGSTATLTLGMAASQASFALMDLFTVLLVTGAGTLSAFGAGFGTVCLGILSGEQLCSLAQGALQPLAGLGNLVLVGALVADLLWRPAGETSGSPAEPGETALASAAPPDRPPIADRLDAFLGRTQEPHHKLLSAKEKAVLLAILTGKTYRQAADELGISESSVKTYMRRVFAKLGVADREELLAAIETV